MLLKLHGKSALVKISASSKEEVIASNFKKPLLNFSRTTWQCISMCWILSWKTWLEVIWIV